VYHRVQDVHFPSPYSPSNLEETHLVLQWYMNRLLPIAVSKQDEGLVLFPGQIKNDFGIQPFVRTPDTFPFHDFIGFCLNNFEIMVEHGKDSVLCHTVL
jgi:hypothetical protein